MNVSKCDLPKAPVTGGRALARTRSVFKYAGFLPSVTQGQGSLCGGEEVVNTALLLQHPLRQELGYTCLGSAQHGAFGQEQLLGYHFHNCIYQLHLYNDTQLTKFRIAMETYFWTYL